MQSKIKISVFVYIFINKIFGMEVPVAITQRQRLLAGESHQFSGNGL